MRIISSILFGIFCCIALSNAKAPEKDSLYQVWQDASVQDSARMEALFHFIKENYEGKKPDSARLFGQQLHDFAVEKENKYFQANGLLILGNAALLGGNNDRARDLLDQSFEAFQTLEDKLGLAVTYNSLGHLSIDLGEFEMALEQLTNSKNLFFELGDSARTTSSLLNMAVIFEKQGKTLQSLEYNQKVLDLAVRFDNKRNEAIARNNLANNNKTLGDI